MSLHWLATDRASGRAFGGEVSLERKAAKSGLWLATFKFITQLVSWSVTIAIARILSPADYGLIAMAMIMTGYIEVFSGLGIGAAIVQKQDVTQDELSGLFWASLIIGALFAGAGCGLAYPTAMLFNEPRLVAMTQVISLQFILGSFRIVPYHLLVRELRFKEIGLIEVSSVIVAGLGMLWMAHRGFGVWALITGSIIRMAIGVMLIYGFLKWLPGLHLRFSEVRPSLIFGANMAGSGSLSYLFKRADQLIVGKMFGAELLGYYSFAVWLAWIPAKKIVKLVRKVTFPVFCKYQDGLAKCQDLYLETTKYVTMVVAPLFFSGVFFGEEIILAVLGEKWAPAAPIFQMLCIAQFIASITSINGTVHNAMGRPHWTLCFNVVNVVLMPSSIWLAATYGFDRVVVAWVSVYPAVCICWTWVTLRKLEIATFEYLRCVMRPVCGTACMIVGVMVIQHSLHNMALAARDLTAILAQEIVIGCLLYLSYLWIFERKSVVAIWGLRRA